ncbi:MAG TPA: hypothetical protein VGC87_09665 [Pyrinomonadaceae bacterium]
MQEALQEDSDNLRFKFPLVPIASGIAAVLAAFTGELSNYVLATIGILTAGSQFSPYYERLKDRALRRQFWFLTDMKDAADGLTISYPRIRDLWELDKYNPKMFSQEVFGKQFARLKALSY